MSTPVLPPTNCPRCNAEQNFKRRVRDAQGKPWQEVYLHCDKCRYEVVVDQTTPMIEAQRKRVHKAHRRVLAEEQQYNIASHATSAVFRRQSLHLNHLTAQLRKEVANDGSTTDQSAA